MLPQFYTHVCMLKNKGCEVWHMKSKVQGQNWYIHRSFLIWTLENWEVQSGGNCVCVCVCVCVLTSMSTSVSLPSPSLTSEPMALLRTLLPSKHRPLHSRALALWVDATWENDPMRTHSQSPSSFIQNTLATVELPLVEACRMCMRISKKEVTKRLLQSNLHETPTFLPPKRGKGLASKMLRSVHNYQMNVLY